jgi:quaternary ammonium compound-resistance protein SugE
MSCRTTPSSSQLQGSARYIRAIRPRRLIRSDALLLAGLLEVAWALGLKYSDGLTRLWPSLGMVTAIGLSFALLAVALKSIPFGTAYALWTGIGAAGTVIVGMAAFGESTDLFRVTCLSLIIAGMVGLKLASSH